MPKTENIDLNSEILTCIDRAFSKFGQSVAMVVYWTFQHETKLRKEDLLERPDLFSSTINTIFKNGSKIVEATIMQELKMHFKLPNRNYANLEDIIGSIRVRYHSEVAYHEDISNIVLA